VHEGNNNLIVVVYQVLSPGDVAFTLGSGNDTTVVLNSSDWDSDNICMSVTSLVGGLVMLLGTVFCCCFLGFAVVTPKWEHVVVKIPRRCCSTKRPRRRQAENRTAT
jgi:hypothetical protein